jgi:hypothetical protein
MRIADLPADTSPAEARDEAWLQRELGRHGRTKNLRRVSEPDPETASATDRTDAMLLRAMDLANRLYALRLLLSAAEQ